MGAEQSNTKSSLLKNFQYIVVEDKENKTGGSQQYKLMYFDYLNFLKYELDHEAWKWGIYSENVKKNGSKTFEECELFCGWKLIQEKIFGILTKKLSALSRSKYTWANYVEPLIDIAGKTRFGSPKCDSITVEFNKIPELNHNGSGSYKVTSSTTCQGIKTASNLHIPLRRRALLVEGIDEYLKEIREKITDPETLREVIQSNVNAQSHITQAAIRLKKKMIDGLSIEFSNLIKEKYKENEHDTFCKEWQRTMDDYHTLFLGDDIVDDNETKGIQCSINLIEAKVKGTNFKKEWSTHFKTIVKELWQKEFTNKNTKEPCDISSENKTQCVRFFEEWAEEFCLLKRDLGKMLVEECGKTSGKNCQGLCSIYKKFLAETKPYFENYVKICTDKTYGGKGSEKDELQQMLSTAANNSTTECCKDNGNCNQHDLFDVTNDKSNIRYKCFCPEGEYKKKPNTDKGECEKYKNTATVSGTVVKSQPPSGMPQNTVATSNGPKTVMQIAQELQREAKTQWQQRDTSSSLVGDISKAKFKHNKNTSGLNKDEVCKLDMTKHTNDKRKYNANVVNDQLHQGPCTGKDNEKVRFVIGGKWETDEQHVDSQNKDVLLPPRRRHMCTSNLENLDVENAQGLKDNSVNHSFTGDVLLSAKEETQRILQMYKKNNDGNDQSGMCRAVRSSFADLGDIIRGTDVWSKNKEMESLQGHLEKIFSKIREQSGIKDKYTSDPSPYTQLRSDWWLANRDQVWGAIKCVVKDMYATTEATSDPKGVTGFASAYCGYNDTTPVDDYIPQKLRWLTEWNENYCKQLERHYKAVEDQCKICRNSGEGKCERTTENCDMCSGMCKVYEEDVKKWKDDWDKQKGQYDKLYENSSNDKFIQELKDKGNTKYKDAADFVDSMGGYKYCKNTKQNKFKDTDKGQDYHVFQEKPKDFKKECECDNNPPPSAGPAPTTPKTRPKSKDIEDCEKTLGNSGAQKVEMSDWDCIPYTEMCIKKGGNYTISDYSKNFDKIFDDWLKLFFEEQTSVKSKSNECTNITSTGSGDCDNKNCNKKCPCYEEWIKRKNQEWRHFKSAYHEVQTINPLLSTSLRSMGKDADAYVKNKKENQLETAYKSTGGTKSNNITIQDILTEESKNVSTCLEKCPIKIGCEKKGFGNPWECKDSGNMCEKNEKDEDNTQTQTGRTSGKQPHSDPTQLFYDLFNEWLHDMEQMLGTGKTLVERTCGNIKMKTTSGTGGGKGGTSTGNEEKDCTQCKDLCQCFEKLKEEIEKQWKKQEEYYGQHKKNAKEEMKNLELETYLEAQCILNESVKTDKQSIQTHDYDDSYKKCETLKGSEENYVKALINKSEKDREKICSVCPDQTTPAAAPTGDCNQIEKINDDHCKEKKYDDKDPKSSNTYERDKNWKCTETGGYLEPNVCVPPRTQPLCIANMYDSKSSKVIMGNTEEELKKELKKAIKKETELLWKKYGTKKDDHDKACRLTHRSLNDFKHMVIGDILWKPESINKVQEQIGKIIEKPNGGGTSMATKDEREKWWKTHEKDFWEAVKCGIKESGNKKTGGGTSLSGNECVRFISDDDQFEWWAKEWSDDFYHKRNELATEVDTKCGTGNTKSGSTNPNCTNGQLKPSTDCNTKCTEYKNFLKKKRDEWNKNFKKFLDDKADPKTSSVNTKEYSPEIFYLLNPCTYQSCDNKYITALLSTKEYGDKQKLCACDATSQKEDETNPCDPTYTEYGCTEKKFDKNIWSSTYVTHQTDRGHVFAPPRRNSMCIGWLFSPIRGSSQLAAKNELRDKLINAARGESHYLYEYYKNKTNGTTGSSSGLPQGYCDALKRSYYDYGDMVQGTDLWNAGYSSHVERNIKAVFSMPESGGTKPDEDQIAKDRENWWNTYKKDIWQQMQCSNHNKCGTTDPPTDYDSHDQFLRWFIEWGENFCEEKKKHLAKLNIECYVKPCNTLCGGTTCEACQKQCALYNKWLMTKKNEWNGQKEKYTQEYKQKKDKHGKYAGTKERPHKYLTDKAKECKDEDFAKLFKKGDTKYQRYKGKCKRCIEELTKDVVHKIQNPNGPSSRNKKLASFCDGKCEDAESKNVYETYVEKDPKYNEIKDKQNCCGLNSHAKNKKIQWRNTEDNNYQHLKKDKNFSTDPVSDNIYIPPRKQLLCFKGLDGSLNDVKDEMALLEHLMKLAAIEGYNLGEYYKEKNKNSADDKYNYDVLPCNALKYSFYDLRDLILGHDMLEPEGTNTEKNLKQIFEKVQKEKGSTDINKERHNFWTQNQQCVWEAMKCGYRKSRDEGSTSGTKPSVQDLEKCTTIPSETDYPVAATRVYGTNLQFLRWFAEWGEDFCVEQKSQLATLKEKCDPCKVNGGKCDKDTQGCQECETQCKEYTKFITQWKTQYDNQRKKFMQDKTKYDKDDDAKDSEHAYQYLNKKISKFCSNSNNRIDCSCMKDPSTQSTSTTGVDTPKSLEDITQSEYEKQCNCNTTSAAKPAPVKPPQTAPCDIVKPLLQGKNANDKVGECKKKYDPSKTTPYPGWDCGNENNSTVPNDGSCMPPRRQKLCLHYLGHRSQTPNINKLDDLRTAFIKCAAAETFLHWNYYIKDGGGKSTNAETELKTNGKIPPDFLRSMMYTFDDLRDLCLDKDISKKNKVNNKNVTEARDKITDVFQNDGGKTDKDTREQWWKQIEEDVWKGMLCALTHNSIGGKEEIKNTYSYSRVTFDNTTTPLSDFVKKPQFLRWMTEWGEDYCVTQKKHYDEVVSNCGGCTVSGSSPKTCDKSGTCKPCDTACKKYQQEVQKWKQDWDKMEKKYGELYRKIGGTTTKEEEKTVVNYLKDKQKSGTDYSTAGKYLKQEGIISGCVDTQRDFANSGGNNYAFAQYPDMYKDKCECQSPALPPPGKPQGPPPQVPTGPQGITNKDGTITYSSSTTTPDGVAKIEIRTKPDNTTTTTSQTANPSTPPSTSPSSNSVTPEPPPGNSDPNTPPPAGGGPTSSKKTDPGSTGGLDPAAGTGGTQQSKDLQEKKDKAFQKTKDALNYLFAHIKEPALTLAQAAGVFGVAGTMQAIETGQKLFEKLKELNNTLDRAKNSQGPSPAPGNSVDPQAPPQQPQPGASGTGGSTGNQNPGAPQVTPGVGPGHSPGAQGKAKPSGPKPPPSSVIPTTTTDIITKIVTPTLVPWAIGIGFAGIVYLWLKKKPKSSPVDLLRVIDIPQNDYGIPDKTTTNRYVPYGKYKGKTYIYVEGEETDDYLRDISSSDVTSSESEYEELDINDIYPYRLPKYKTLIEVVLKPTKQPSDILSGDIPSGIYSDKPSDIPSHIPIEEEWNEVKHDFILNMLQNDIPGNTTDTNTSYSGNPIEQPFITQIQDRKLYSDDNEIIYNIDWNVPENITTNNVDIPTYVSQNLYSGTDLINDSLNSGNDIDIYDELLKRKENELYGTKYMKHTTTNSVSKKTNRDPISNQIDLFHKWLDRHRDMCEQCNNKEEMLSKLNDEWNKSNTIHVSKDNYDENNLEMLLVHEEYNLNNTRTN